MSKKFDLPNLDNLFMLIDTEIINPQKGVYRLHGYTNKFIDKKFLEEFNSLKDLIKIQENIIKEQIVKYISYYSENQLNISPEIIKSEKIQYAPDSIPGIKLYSLATSFEELSSKTIDSEGEFITKVSLVYKFESRVEKEMLVRTKVNLGQEFHLKEIKKYLLNSLKEMFID